MTTLKCTHGSRLLEGLTAATFTPLHQNGELNLAAIPRVVEHLVQSGISGMYVLGSTGEGLSLTVEERQRVAEAFVKASTGRLPVVVQVGCESLSQARMLAAHAQSIGADAVSAISPLYFKPDSVQTLVGSMAEIACGASALPFFYYHIPNATGVRFSMLDFLRVAFPQIPNLRGIKYSSVDVDEFQACVEFAAGNFELLWGVDEMLADGLAAGATGAIGSTYNFAAPIYHRLQAAWAAGDLAAARQWQERSQAIVAAFLPFGPRAAQKAIMAMIGVDCGPCRLPLQSLTPSQTAALRESLCEAGFFVELEPDQSAARAAV